MRKAVLLLLGGIVLAFQAGICSAQESLRPLADSAWDYAKARHLLFRAGFGGSPAEVEKLQAMGLAKAVEYLVDFQGQADVQIALPTGQVQQLDPKALAKLDPKERQKIAQQNRRNDFQYMQDIREWWVKRMVNSPRPLEEKMVLFWHSILASDYRTVRNAQAMLGQNQLFREHAAGNYGKLLHGVPRDPAMLRYLDNNKNVKGKPNENLAREIMELFSMGEGQGYTEKDIKEAARALTGYNYNPKTWEFIFNDKAHDKDPKTIFGKTGNWNGDTLVDLILEQPATSKFVAKRLFTYFVQDEPDEAAIEQMAKVLKDSNYALGPTLKTLFMSEYFYSPKAMGNLIKSPVQLVVGTLRTLGIREANPSQVAVAVKAMGQELFEPPNVKGWDGGKEWVNSATLFARQNFAVLMVSRAFEGLPKGQPKIQPGRKDPPLGAVARVDLVTLLQNQKLETPEAVVDYFIRAMFLAPVSESKRAELVGFLGQLPPAAQWGQQRNEISRRVGSLLILMMSMPEYQLA